MESFEWKSRLLASLLKKKFLKNDLKNIIKNVLMLSLLIQSKLIQLSEGHCIISAIEYFSFKNGLSEINFD